MCGRALSAAARMRSIPITRIIVRGCSQAPARDPPGIYGHTLQVPIYEYRCAACNKRSSALLASYSTPDPRCPHCDRLKLTRLVSTFATARGEDSGGDDDFGGGEESDFGGGDQGGFDGDDDY